MTNKLEINVRSLIAHCEEMAKEDTNQWRLKKYIKSLDTMIDELQTTDPRPSSTAIDEYFTRCALMKKSINYVPDSPPKSRKLKARTAGIASGNGGANSEAVIREINQIHNANYDNEQRTELLGADDSGSGTFGGQQQMRRRTAALSAASSASATAGAAAASAKAGNGSGGGEMGQAMKYYDDVQERIAEDMLSLTRSLREQTETANRIIRRDTEVVSTAAHLSDRNLGALGREAEKLEEHSRRAWKCWMWLMIGFVMVIFIFMVMFMKIMKKRTT